MPHYLREAIPSYDQRQFSVRKGLLSFNIGNKVIEFSFNLTIKEVN